MIIVFVIDTYGRLTNGTTMTAYRFVEALKSRGHTVRIVGCGVEGKDMYPVRERRIPIVTPIARKQSTFFAYPDEAVLRKAFEGADLVHFFMPWSLARKGRRLAGEMGIPCTAAFHVQPENITYGAGLGRLGKPLARLIYAHFRLSFYRHVENIHCPSAFIAGELRRHRYRARLHVISNGVAKEFSMEGRSAAALGSGGGSAEGGERRAGAERGFDILMVGRYAPEKRQDVLIKAISLSRHEAEISLHLAGAGPREARLRRLSSKLTNGATFGFYGQDELIKLIRSCDLYVHAADVEIEAIACLEALSCGKVPVISDSAKSATGQFALDARSLFKAGSARDLARKIDYWIEHEAERREMELRYAERGKVFGLDYSVLKAEGMFREAISDLRCRESERTPEGGAYARRVNKALPKRVFSLALYYLVAAPLLWLYCSFVLHLRVRNRRAVYRTLRRGGAVTVMNHVHVLDAPMASLALWPWKPIYTSLPSNFRLPFAGFLVDSLGAVPVPTKLSEDRIFFYELSRQLREGRSVHFYPEGELVRNDRSLRPFKRGAFQLAVDAGVPVLPLGLEVRRGRKGPFGLRFGRRIILRAGEALRPDPQLVRKDAIDDLMARSFAKVRELARDE